MLAVFHEGSAGSPPFSGADQFRLEGLAGLGRDFTDIHLIAGNALLGIGFLENQPFTVKTEIGFGVVSPESKLTDVPKMRLIRICQRIGEA